MWFLKKRSQVTAVNRPLLAEKQLIFTKKMKLKSEFAASKGGYGGTVSIIEYENCHFGERSSLQTPLVSIPLRKHCKKSWKRSFDTKICIQL